MSSDKIVGGMGVIENDFHDRKDLTLNVCAVYTEKDYRCKGIVSIIQINRSIRNARKM